ncbi:zinc finger MYM-type protein 1-like [Tenebrio molitor]|uniref:zinc finger MYM-type protein 1-like n=1 Tax=Tenebrio molitor TaxID=7067 RepID=UPI003624AC43
MDIRNFFVKKSRLEDSNNSHVTIPKSNDHQAGDDNVQIASTSSNYKNQNTPAPSDLVGMGKLIKQVELKTYPKQANGRSFHSDWYKKFKWLEYSVQSDAAFCYACRQFQPFANKEKTYTETGYRNWKNALDSKNGFPKHENTEVHITSMKMWKEKLARQNTGISVSTLVNHNILEKHRYYIKSIAEIIQFLAINELALRGAYEAEEHAERSLFSNLFKFTLKKDTLLSECAQHIPKNANYTSPAIQNEIIEILSDMVRESVVADIRNADVPWFTLMEDGTRDKNNRENISIAIRYVKNGKVFEELDAKNFTDLTLDIMEKNNLDTSRLLSQCYDGASVMSGKRGGVAALIQKKLKRNVPYVHCANHRLHLVVIKMVSDVAKIKHFFDQCILLHTFFQHGKVAAIYEGKSIVRVLDQRWSGHLAIVNVISSNFKEILKTLDAIIKSDKFTGEDVAKCIGLKSVMLGIEFRFSLMLMRNIL